MSQVTKLWWGLYLHNIVHIKIGSLEQEGAELQFCVSVLTLQNLSSAMTNSHKKK